MKRSLFVLALLTLVGAGFAQIRIGALYNVTGGMASIDGPGLDGMRLAADEINAAGGLLGEPVDLVAIDGRTDADALTDALGTLADEEDVVAVGGLNDSTFALAAGPILHDAGIPFVIAGATLPTLPERIGDDAFMVAFGDDAQSHAIVDYAVDALGARTYAMLYDETFDFTLAVRAFAHARFAERVGADALLLDVGYRSGADDIAARIARLRALDPQPDVLFVSAVPDDAGPLVLRLREAGLAQPIVSADGFDTPLLVETAGEAADGVYFATHVALSSDAPRVRAFADAYEAAYGAPPANAFAALGYDTLRLIADAIERAGSTERDAVRDALARTEGFEGVTGVIAYREGSRVPHKTVAILGVHDGVPTFEVEVTP